MTFYVVYNKHDIGGGAMSDFLTFLYEGYIKPYLDRQSRDDGDAFLLGVRTGAGLRQNGAL